jgi:toxin ParE1/3/4
VRIRWTRQARADIDAAFEYVAADNIHGAEQIVDRIQEAAAILARHPTAGRTGRVPGTRELIVAATPWVIPYRVRRGFIDIFAVIHSARKWPEDL